MSQGTLLAQMQPFRAAIICSYTSQTSGKLQPDPHVPATLSASHTAYRGNSTRCYASWADAATVAHPQRSTPPDWTSFDSAAVPVVWRYAQAGDFGGNFTVDAVNPGGNVVNAVDFMLVTQPWQPNAASPRNFGFITDQADGITAAQITTIQETPIPSFKDTGGHYTLGGGPVRVIGRYLKPNVIDPPGHPQKGSFAMKRPEAAALSAVPEFQIFTIWEDIDHVAGQATTIDYFDPANNMGAKDGKNAFAYCGDVLGQPPHTPVFFTVDFDAGDPNDGGPHAREWITGYFEAVKQARDAYTTQNPDRPFLIGLYCEGTVNQWCYEQGIVDMFWQSGSPGTSGNTLPQRPWYHANRWQFNENPGLKAAKWNVVSGADPDLDWGDGGTWTLADPLSQQLDQVTQFMKGVELGGKLDFFGNLVLPPPLGPGLPPGAIQ